MPIFSRLETTTASESEKVGVLRLGMTRFEQAEPSQTPSLLVSYLDCFISSLALASSPRVEPPQACWMPALSITQLTALRTWMSSKGGTAQFMVMYQVRSPELLCR